MLANLTFSWTVGENWPSDGEIDIIEGANRALYNQMTLHTGNNCTIDSTGLSGNLLTSNCDVDAAGQSRNAGCGIEAGSATSFGSQFNSIGGGIYAMEWTSNGIAIWFFPRYQIPTGFMSRPSHDPDGWGEPLARFQGDCQIAQHFHTQKIVSAWPLGSCPAACHDLTQRRYLTLLSVETWPLRHGATVGVSRSPKNVELTWQVIQTASVRNIGGLYL